MTPEQLAEIKARVGAATPGPWEACPYHPDEIQPAKLSYCGFSTGEIIADICLAYVDAAFILNARTDIPALIAEIERLQADNDHIRAMLKEEHACSTRYEREVIFFVDNIRQAVKDFSGNDVIIRRLLSLLDKYQEAHQ